MAGTSSAGLRRAMAAAALVATAAALVGLPARATYGARTSADEPQYLLTATSLAADRDLDIADELATAAYLDYHEVPIDRQTATRTDGRRISPHDPLLPALLAWPMAIGGWAAAKATLALIAGATAATIVWAGVRRLGLAPPTVVVVTAAAFAGLPLAAYGSQVYPEMPAALALTVAAVSVTDPDLVDRRRSVVIALLAIVALPWLAVKYVPLAAVAGLALLARLRSRPRVAVVALVTAALAAVGYLAAHRWLYGGWTVYASGDHFVDRGEFAVVGTDVDLVGRSRRLTGLLVDGGFGLVVWSPLWLLLPMAVGERLGRWRPGVGRGAAAPADRPPLGPLALSLLAVTWSTATFVALTMHGWWVPGRQLVVGLPMAVLLVSAWVDGSGRRRRLAAWLGLVGAVNWLWLAIEASTGRRTLIVDFTETGAPGFRLLTLVLPDGTSGRSFDSVLLAAWSVVVVAAMVLAARRPSDRPARSAGVDPPSVIVRR